MQQVEFLVQLRDRKKAELGIGEKEASKIVCMERSNMLCSDMLIV